MLWREKKHAQFWKGKNKKRNGSKLNWQENRTGREEKAGDGETGEGKICSDLKSHGNCNKLCISGEFCNWILNSRIWNLPPPFRRETQGHCRSGQILAVDVAWVLLTSSINCHRGQSVLLNPFTHLCLLTAISLGFLLNSFLCSNPMRS